MIIYIILLILSVVIILIRHNAVYFSFKHFVIFLFLIFLFILEIFRSITVGADYRMYYSFFTSYSAKELRDILNIEPAYVMLTHFAINIDNFYIIPLIVLLVGIIGIISLNHEFKINKFLILSLFVLTGIYFQSFDILRQFIAIGIICIGASLFIKLYKYKFHMLKYIIFILFVYIAFQFHRSAIFALIFLILPKVHFNKGTVLFSSILSLIFAANYNFENIFNNLMNKVPYYSTKYGSIVIAESIHHQSPIMVLIKVLPVILQFILLYLFISKNYQLENYKTKFILSGYLFYLIISMFISFWGDGIGLRRIQMYFLIFPMFYSGMFIDDNYLINVHDSILKKTSLQMHSSYLNKILLVILWICIYMAKLIIDNESIVPYKFL